MNLSKQIEDIATDFKMPSWLKAKLLKTREDVVAIFDSWLRLDYRVWSTPDNFCLENLEFNPEKTTTVTVYFQNEKEVIWVTSFVIIPKIVFSKKRYFRKENENIRLISFEDYAWNGNDFMIVPAWTNLKDEYKWKNITSIFRINKLILEEIIKSAPLNTCIEVVAMWQHKISDKKEYEASLDSIWIGNVVPLWQYSNEDVFWKPHSWARATCTYAKHFDLAEVSSIADSTTFGPVFFKNLNR